MKSTDLENRAKTAATALCTEFADTLMMLSPHALATLTFMRGYTAGFGDAADSISTVPAPPKIHPNRCPLCGQDYAQVWSVRDGKWISEPCNCTRTGASAAKPA